MSADYDLIVVGDGVAGLTASLFAARHGRRTVVLGSIGGGELLNVEAIEDFPGFPVALAGFDLCPAMVEQVLANGVELRGAQVLAIEAAAEDRFSVQTEQGAITARAAIIASGASPRRLGVPGEDRLEGMGVSHCASCDGPIFRGQTVAVVGGGDSAVQEALVLARHVERVLILHNRPELVAQRTYVDRALEHPSIEVKGGVEVVEIVGEGAVTGLRARDIRTGEETSIELSAVFVYVGLAPQTDFLGDLLQLDDSGAIAADALMRTSVAGIFAAGSVRADAAGQAISSAGDGATAAVSAHRYLIASDDRVASGS